MTSISIATMWIGRAPASNSQRLYDFISSVASWQVIVLQSNALITLQSINTDREQPLFNVINRKYDTSRLRAESMKHPYILQSLVIEAPDQEDASGNGLALISQVRKLNYRVV